MNSVEDLEQLPGRLPDDTVSQELKAPPTSCSDFVQAALPNLQRTSLTDEILWRDLFCFTGSHHTLSGAAEVLKVWHDGSTRGVPSCFVPSGAGRITRRAPAHSWIDVPFSFTIQCTTGLRGKCSGTASLIPHHDTWKIWLLTTVLEQFEELGNPDIPPIPKDTCLVPESSPCADTPVSVVIIGAGHSGLSIAGRLNALGLDCLVIDKGATIGSSWTKDKYDSVHLHTIRDMNHLPFAPTYSPDDPNYLSSEFIAKGFARYVDRYVPKVWLSTTVQSCTYDENSKTWNIVAHQHDKTRLVNARHLCIATGGSSMTPYMPDFVGMANFEGEILHTASYKNSKAWAGRRALIIGTGTSAHDVAEDMVRADVKSLTMVQRGATAIFPSTWLAKGAAVRYNSSIPTEVADRANALPFAISRTIVQTPTRMMMHQHPKLFEDLERAGFRVNRHQGLLDLTIMRAGGYYIDFGTSSRIINGEIKIKSNAAITNFTPKGVRFEDGEEIAADVIVLATGYVHDYPRLLASLIGHKAAEQVATGGFWGLDAEGEQKGVMRPVLPGLWLQAGGPMHARWFSRFVALQIQADLLGHPFQDKVSR